jgi:hypothetical protein
MHDYRRAFVYLFAETAVDCRAKNARKEAEAVTDTVNDGHAKNYVRNGYLFQNSFCLSVSNRHLGPRLQLSRFLLRFV